MNPPVGPATIAGLVTAVTGFATAIISFCVADPGVQQQLGVIVSSGIAVVALVATMIGRYIQAHKATPTPAPPK